ncbi:MAG: acyl-CoA thioesterase [Hylemonella sp.]
MKIEIPEKKKLVYQTRFPIRWGDMDSMGHVNNVMYFRYIESARIDWFRSVGVKTNPNGEGFVIVNAFCNFYKQFEYPADILLKLYVSDPGRATLETWATMERPEAPGVLHAAGGGTAIWVDFPRQKSIQLPDWLRALAAD